MSNTATTNLFHKWFINLIEDVVKFGGPESAYEFTQYLDDETDQLIVGLDIHCHPTEYVDEGIDLVYKAHKINAKVYKFVYDENGFYFVAKNQRDLMSALTRAVTNWKKNTNRK